MTSYRRSERIAVIMKTLCDRPNTIFPLRVFAERFGVSKPTLSEDIAIIRKVLCAEKMGQVETLSGASGGVRYVTVLNEDEICKRLRQLAECLSVSERILPGLYLYMTDIVFSPIWSSFVGKLFATMFHGKNPDNVVTVETKGIPLALMTARALGCPLVVVRRNARVSEGPSVSINYMSGSDERIQTMSLPKRALDSGSRCLVVDDFMRAGGTARGIVELLSEFRAHVVGVGVLIESDTPETKQISNYVSLLKIRQIKHDLTGVVIQPGPHMNT